VRWPSHARSPGFKHHRVSIRAVTIAAGLAVALREVPGLGTGRPDLERVRGRPGGRQPHDDREHAARDQLAQAAAGVRAGPVRNANLTLTMADSTDHLATFREVTAGVVALASG
jgi:hypothetical protein